MKYQPQALMIDFYGTLVEEIHLPVKAICDRVCGASSQKIKEQDFVQYWVKIFSRLSLESYGVNFKLLKEIEQQSLQAAIDHFGIDLDASDLSRELIHYRGHPKLFPESQTVVDSLTIPVCLLTNIDNAEIQSALRFTGLSFNWVVTSEDCRAYKPRPEVFQNALSIMGKKAFEVLHVGDSWQGDIQGAQTMEIPVLWIDRRHRPLPDGAQPPDYTASDLNSLTELLSR
jgi:2-haloalkanoic acid dehalogenase type II